MRNSEHNSVTGILLGFTKLSEVEQNAFISRMNEFLLASHQRRKLFVEQWKSEYAAPETPAKENRHANQQK